MQALLILAALTAVLLVIAVEDFCSRSVHWWLFPVLLFLGYVWGRHFISLEEWFGCFLLNATFVLIQLGLISIWFSIKSKKLVNISKGLLGLGDILFLICVCGFSSFPLFVMFYVASLISSLITALAVPQIRKRGIPLAGLQAVQLVPVLWTIYFLKSDPFKYDFINLIPLNLLS